MRQLIRSNPFMVGLLGAVLLAFLFPQLGARDGPLQAGRLARAGVMLIFFLQGLALRPRELASGAGNLRLHALVQGWIFLLSPCVFIPAALLLRAAGHPDLAAGFIYLALIPTTISSAIAFTAAAGGNVPAALFNTTFSNIFGVFWVPAGCLVLFAASGDATGMLGGLLLNLARLILLPLAIGQLVRPLVHRSDWFARLRPRVKVVNHGIILFIVFSTFSQSVLDGSWRNASAGAFALVLLLALAAVPLIHGGVWISSGWLLHSHADRVAALFCGAQKTLATGAPMAVAIFAGNGELGGIDTGLLLLPLLCYHPLQLLLAAALMARLGRR
jgi:sodium/bile acid cotransporter 7